MTVISKSVAGPTNTSYQLTTFQSSACVLTDERVVWVYSSTSGARGFTVIDTPGGWHGANTPTTTETIVTGDTGYYTARVLTERLNDDTFAVLIPTGSDFFVSIYQVAANSTVSRVGTLNLANANGFNVGGDLGGGANLRALQDNRLAFSFLNSMTAPSYITISRLDWNPTSKVMTWTVYRTNLTSITGTNYYPEMFTKSIPNSSRYLLCVRTSLQSGGMIPYYNQYAHYFMMNSDGNLNDYIGGNGRNFAADLWPLSETRFVYTTGGNDFAYIKKDGTEEGRHFNIGRANPNVPSMGYGLTPDFYMVIARDHFLTNTGFTMKVLRRDDTNITTLCAAADAASSATGLSVPTITRCVPHADKQRPRFWSNGDLYWFGVSGRNLVWNVIKNPQ